MELSIEKTKQNSSTYRQLHADDKPPHEVDTVVYTQIKFLVWIWAWNLTKKKIVYF